jgi:putative membrane protein
MQTLSGNDLERIRAAVVAAEAGTSGEIVPCVVDTSDSYEVVKWRASAAAVASFLTVTLLVYLFYRGWALGWLYSGLGLSVGVVLSALIGVSLVSFSRLAFRFIAGSALLASRVRANAERMFIREGVFRTEKRTGILILVSIQERRIEIVADVGITDAIDAGSWNSVIEPVSKELRQNDLAEALIVGATACGELLRTNGFVAAKDDSNELPDDLRFEAS